MDMADAALIARQDALHAEATAVLDDLRLLAPLGEMGEVALIGSYALGLMVWRDLDIHIYCPTLTAARVFSALRPMAMHPRVIRLNFDNWRGPNAIPAFPDGYYWGIHYRAVIGCEWKLDLWFLPEGTPREATALVARMTRDLKPETRHAILSLKEIWHRLPSYGRMVTSVDVYDAVLYHVVRTPDDFARYLRSRSKPVDAPC